MYVDDSFSEAWDVAGFYGALAFPMATWFCGAPIVKYTKVATGEPNFSLKVSNFYH